MMLLSTADIGFENMWPSTADIFIMTFIAILLIGLLLLSLYSFLLIPIYCRYYHTADIAIDDIAITTVDIDIENILMTPLFHW